MPLSDEIVQSVSFVCVGIVIAWLAHGRLTTTPRHNRIRRDVLPHVGIRWHVDEMGLYTYDIKPGTRTPFVGSGYDRYKPLGSA